MEKKYKLTEETLEIDGHVLNRIIALRDFGEVKKGDLGGFIEKESNLAHDWNCWIYNDAVVCGNAEVYGYAMVYGEAKVCGEAEVYGYAMVYGEAKVCGNAKVEKNPTTSCSRIGGAVEDILLGHARTICGLLGAFTVRVRNLSRRLMLTARRKVVSMRE
jgi:hypothetical protein